MGVELAKEVLVVEDDRRIADMCARALETEGYDVLQAHDGLEALEMIARMPPALIVLDLLLPKRDGRAVLAELAQSSSASSVPVIAISGVFKGKSTERELQDAGAKAFLPKPFEVASLVELVRQYAGPAEPEAEVADWSRAHLEDVAAAEFLWRLMDKGVSGVVHFRRGKLQKCLLLEQGRPVAVRSNAAAETLARFLLGRRQIDEVAYQALQKLSQKGVRHGEGLVQMKLLTAEQLVSTLRAQSAAKALELFAWVDGEAWLQEGVDQVAHASTLEGWTPIRLLLRGVKYVPYDRVMATLTPFAAFSAELTDFVLPPSEAKLPHVRALLNTLRRPTQVGRLLSEHAPVLYGLWLVGGVHFRIPGMGEDPQTGSGSLSSVAIPEAGKAAELQESLRVMHAQNHFELLGVGQEADEQKVQAAYLQLAKRFHPDRFASETAAVKTLVSEIFSLISTARDVLLDPARRADYVVELGGGATGAKRVDQVIEAEKLCREGEALLKKREYEQALARFERACELDPDEGELHALCGWAYFVVNRKLGDGQRVGIARIERAIALAPESTKGYYYMAQLQKACGRPDLAQKLLKKVLDIDPNHVEAGQALRVLRMRASNDKKGATGGLFGFGRKKS